VIGVIQVINKRQGGAFTKHDEFLLALFASFANQLLGVRATVTMACPGA
jgi:hypothetical protein